MICTTRYNHAFYILCDILHFISSKMDFFPHLKTLTLNLTVDMIKR